MYVLDSQAPCRHAGFLRSRHDHTLKSLLVHIPGQSLIVEYFLLSSVDPGMAAPCKVNYCITHPDMAAKYHTEVLPAGVIESWHGCTAGSLLLHF